MLAIGAYILSVVLVNVGFSVIPPIMTPLGLFAPMAIVVGFTFVIRDYAQRAAGHWVLLAMAAATALSFVLADPYVATASALAFATSELVDWALYTFSKQEFHKRILWSSLLSTPVDTAVFLLGISSFSVGTFVIMFVSKMLAAVVIYFLYGARQIADAEQAYMDTHDLFETPPQTFRR